MEARPVITTLKNHLLVANATLNGTEHERTVIYVTRNDAEGSRGFILNQPLPLAAAGKEAKPLEVMLTEAFQGFRPKAPKLLRGGTVESDRVFAIHSPRYRCPRTVDISPFACLSTPEDIAPALMHDLVPWHSNLCYGYTAWEAGELEATLHGSDWFVLPASEAFLFQVAPEDRYRMATRALGLNALNFTGTIGKA